MNRPFLAALAVACVVSSAQAQDSYPVTGRFTFSSTYTGVASWYGYESGTQTASGRKFNPHEMTCAMRRRDWGRVLLVTVIETGASAECTLTDYGPAKSTGRIIDVSEAMAKKLGFHKRGIVRVRIE